MKILCVSDTTSSLAFSSVMKDVYAGTDLILSAGDMPLKSYDYLSTMLRRDLCYVYGNHNLEDFGRTMKKEEGYKKNMDNLLNPFYGFLLDGKCIREKNTGLLIAGLGGSMAYNGGCSQYTETQMRNRIRMMFPRLLYNKKRYGRYLDILITHAPPRGIGDEADLCHTGFSCFLDFMDRFQPKYLIHGHVHLIDGNVPRETQYKNTTVINVYGSYLLDDDALGEKKKNGKS